MYALASKLHGLPVLSLQTAEPITVVCGLVVKTDNLEVVALKCQERPGLGTQPVLLMRDIRQVAVDCLLVNSAEDLSDASEIVRLKELLSSPLELRGMRVVTDMQRRLGSVEDYTVHLQSYCVQKLYIKQPVYRSWTGSSLIVDRTQIIEVGTHEIVVTEGSIKATDATKILLPKTAPKHNS